MRAVSVFSLPVAGAIGGLVLLLAAFASSTTEHADAQSGCLPDYPNICLPAPPPDLDCDEISLSNIAVLTHPDPHGLDSDGDGIACENNGKPPAPPVTPTPPLPYRVFGIQVAKDQQPAPPTATPTRTPVATATNPPAPTSTQAPPTATATQAPPTATATQAPPTATQPPATCGGATASIIALDKVGEVVTLTGSGNLTGWSLVSERGAQKFTFPNGFVANGTFTIVSDTGQFPNTANRLWWANQNYWHNTLDDDAILYNCLGQQVQRFEDGD